MRIAGRGGGLRVAKRSSLVPNGLVYAAVYVVARFRPLLRSFFDDSPALSTRGTSRRSSLRAVRISSDRRPAFFPLTSATTAASAFAMSSAERRGRRADGGRLCADGRLPRGASWVSAKLFERRRPERVDDGGREVVGERLDSETERRCGHRDAGVYCTARHLRFFKRQSSAIRMKLVKERSRDLAAHLSRRVPRARRSLRSRAQGRSVATPAQRGFDAGLGLVGGRPPLVHHPFHCVRLAGENSRDGPRGIPS